MCKEVRKPGASVRRRKNSLFTMYKGHKWHRIGNRGRKMFIFTQSLCRAAPGQAREINVPSLCKRVTNSPEMVPNCEKSFEKCIFLFSMMAPCSLRNSPVSTFVMEAVYRWGE